MLSELYLILVHTDYKMCYLSSFQVKIFGVQSLMPTNHSPKLPDVYLRFDWFFLVSVKQERVLLGTPSWVKWTFSK